MLHRIHHRRVSPYNSRKQESFCAAGPARGSTASRHFFTSPGRSAASRPVAKTIDLQGDTDSCCGSSFGPAANAKGKTASPPKSPPKTPTTSVDEDFPPLIDALMMSKGAAAEAVATGDAPQRPDERTHKDKDKSEERVSPTAGKTHRPSKITGERGRERMLGSGGQG